MGKDHSGTVPFPSRPDPPPLRFGSGRFRTMSPSSSSESFTRCLRWLVMQRLMSLAYQEHLDELFDPEENEDTNTNASSQAS